MPVFVGQRRSVQSKWSAFSLFGDNDNGFYYDFDKTDRLFKESLGNNLVTADGDTVGLAFEQSKWRRKALSEILVNQPEMILNGDGNSVVGWSMNTASGAGTVTSVGGALRVNITSGAFVNAYQAIATTVGKTYRVGSSANVLTTVGFRGIRKADNQSMSTQVIELNTGAGSLPFKYSYFRATATTSYIGLQVNASGFPGTVDFDDITCVEVPGNHSQQTTGSACPFWKTGRFLRFDGSDDNLLTGFIPSNRGGVIAYRGVMNTAGTYAIGSQIDTTDRSAIVCATGGFLEGRCGSTSATTGLDIRGLMGTSVLTWQNNQYALFWNGQVIMSGSYAGTINSTQPYRLGAANAAGVAAGFNNGDAYQFFARDRTCDANEALRLTNTWSQ